jgi:hypothetical protein
MPESNSEAEPRTDARRKVGEQDCDWKEDREQDKKKLSRPPKAASAVVRGGEQNFTEPPRMADHTPYQRKIIERYYKNLDAILFQRLSELATDLYLAEGKKRERLWAQVGDNLRKLEFPEPRIAHLLQERDPALLVGILKELPK